MGFEQDYIMDLTARHVMNTYARQPLVLERAEGSFVWDVKKKKYLDFCTGLSVNNLGHRPPEIVAAIQEQLESLLHCSNLYYSIPSVLLARQLTELTFAKRVFFCNSGAEANEAALKLARRYGGIKKGETCKEIICMKRSFHGRTLATLSATGQEKIRAGFEPFMPGFRFVEFGDLQEVEKAVNDNTAGIILEPIQAEGGVFPAPEGYLQGLRALCDRKEILLILDEVQTGMGRTGKFSGHEWDGVTPDIMTMSKALGGGLPLGACLASEAAAAAFEPGKHASTFGGNPLACAAGLAMVKGVSEPKLLNNCLERSRDLFSHLNSLAKDYDSILDVRGRGLMMGVEFDFEVKDLVSACREKGLLLCTAGVNTLRFLPPLNIESGDLQEGLNILDEVLARLNRP